MICNKCGANVADGSVFCTSCGASLAESAPSNPYENTYTAPETAAPYGEPAPATPYGEPTPATPYGEPAPAPDYAAAVKKAKKGKGGIIAIIAAVVAVAIIASVFFVAFSGASLKGPMGKIMKAAMNTVEAGFTVEVDITEQVNDSEPEKSVMHVAALGMDEETEELLPGVAWWGDDDDDDDKTDSITYKTPEYSFYNTIREEYDRGHLSYNEYNSQKWAFEEIFALVAEMDTKGIAKYLNQHYFGHRALDEREFSKRAKDLLKLLNDEDYLADNFGFSENSNGDKTTYSFEVDVEEALELVCDFVKESPDVFIWEYDYENVLEDIEDELDSWKEKNRDTAFEIEIVIEGDYITEFSAELADDYDYTYEDYYGESTTERKECTYTYEGELADFGEAEIDSEVTDSFDIYKSKLDTARDQKEDVTYIEWDEEGVSYYDYDTGEDVYLK